MFSKIMIANRGEIALRILRAARELGIKTVVAHSEADVESLPVLLADEAVCVGPASAAGSYLNIPNLLSAAIITGAEAIHPGYGFLAENSRFAAMCSDHNLVFVGPTPENMQALGDKASARELAQKAGVPVVPGSGIVDDLSDAALAATEIGYPVLIKASAGGGGRGMRAVRSEAELPSAFAQAREEAKAAFGRPDVYLEKLIERPKHVEVQVLGDGQRVVHLFERDCSLQRRHQKLLEEAPSGVSEKVRQELLQSAIKLCREVGYVSAGTLEFLVAPSGEFYFIEMNTRIQVEHPITELITGIDLVQEQFRIASGEPLRYRQDQITLRGHALEVRVNAEDPEHGFRPTVGKVETLLWPGGPGIRIDSHLYADYVVPSHYDSLLGKIVAWAENRPAAIERMLRALSETAIDAPGMKTTVPFARKILADPRFRAGEAHTNFLNELEPSFFGGGL